MLKVQRYSSTFTPGVALGTRNALMPFARPASPLVRANTTQCVATCMPVVHIFSPSMRQPSTPLRVSRTARVSMCVASEPCCGSVSPNATMTLPSRLPRMNCSFCAGAAEVAHHHDERKIADDRVLVLQIVVQPETLRREMLANHRHPQVRAAVAAVLARQREAIEAGAVSAAARFRQQLFPFASRQAAALEIGARPFAAMIEEALVVVLRLQRRDFRGDECIEPCEIAHQIGAAARSPWRQVPVSRRYDAYVG